jgi:dinuclear metal center YbgI/SA1388 family protein
MSTVADVLALVDRIAPFAKAASWDPVGLQLGDPQAPAGRLGVCHEVTGDVVDASIEHGIDTLVAYHPLLFDATRRVTAGSNPAGRAFDLIRRGIALIVVHTAFDVTDGGCADALAGALDLSDVAPFGPAWPADAAKVVTFAPAEAVDGLRRAMARAGAGIIGRYSSCSFGLEGTGTFVPEPGSQPVSGSHGGLSRETETRIEMITPVRDVDAVVAALVAAHPYDEAAYDVIATRSNAAFVGRVGTTDSTAAALADLVTERLGVTPRVAGSGRVRRVAVVPGSGGSLVDAAAGVADVLVTGDITHHRARAALDRGLAVLDPGHIATERPGVQNLYASVSAGVGGADVVDLTGVRVSPWEDG